MPRASAKSNQPPAATPSRPPTSHARKAHRAGETGPPAPFRIAADGTWFHQGSPVLRRDMVKLFARALKCEQVGGGSASYALVTPYERHVVLVEDAPFVAVAVRSVGEAQNRVLTFVTNVDDEVTADREHPIVVRTGAAGDPRPYLALGGGMEALIARSVYYELAALAEADAEGRLGVWSGGAFFPLDPADRRR